MAGAVWVATGADGATVVTGTCGADGADAGFATTPRRVLGTTFTGGLVAGTFDSDDVDKGVVEVAGAAVTDATAGTAPEAAALGAEAAGSG